MRTFKFRAWDNVANEMHLAGEDIDLLFQLGSEGIECTDIREMTSCGSCLGEMEHLIYMQYTGLKDKNGVEIYEGDIIQADNSSPIGNVVTAHVFFKEAGFALLTTRGSDTSIGYLVMIHPYSVVTGNIYQHPYLLEDEDA